MRYILIMALIFSLNSCKKDTIQYVFNGNITESISTIKISDVTLKFHQKEVNNNSLNPNYVYLGETKTDINGDFSFTFDRKKILSVKIEFLNDDFYDHEVIIGSGNLVTNETNLVNEKLDAKAWVKIRLINDFVETGEQLNFHKHNVYENCIGCCNNGLISIFDTTPDTTFICNVLGSDYFNYTYGQVSENTSFTESILCSKGDTTSLVISY